MFLCFKHWFYHSALGCYLYLKVRIDYQKCRRKFRRQKFRRQKFRRRKFRRQKFRRRKLHSIKRRILSKLLGIV